MKQPLTEGSQKRILSLSLTPEQVEKVEKDKERWNKYIKENEENEI